MIPSSACQPWPPDQPGQAGIVVALGSYTTIRDTTLGSATARKYGITRSQLNDWRSAAQAGRLGPLAVDGFVPALIVPEVPAALETPMPSAAGRMEVVSANGRRVIVDRHVDVEVLLRIVRGLETLR